MGMIRWKRHEIFLLLIIKSLFDNVSIQSVSNEKIISESVFL